MPGTNQYLAVATGGGANVQAPATYAANPLLPVGNQPGIASSAFNNTALRQCSMVAAALMQLIVNKTGLNALDDGNLANLITLMGTGLNKAPTFTELTSGSGTYTPPAGVQWLRVRMVGGGGGGSGSAGADGSSGGDTTFGANLTAGHGSASLPGGFSTAGFTGTIIQAMSGQLGKAGVVASDGGSGGSNPLGLGAVLGSANFAGPGAGGNGSNATGSFANGYGGSSGGFLDVLISTVAASYAYAVGAGGAKGASAAAGNPGGAGLIIIEEHY